MIDNSDRQAIYRDASAALAASSVWEIRLLNVCGERDTLRVTGHVGSFYHKQLALETVKSVSRGLQILNRVEVS